MRSGMNVANAHAARQAGVTTLAASPWGRPLISELLEALPDPVIGCDAKGASPLDPETLIDKPLAARALLEHVQRRLAPGGEPRR
jgi:hypothetical protein